MEKEIVIVSAARTPIGSLNGTLSGFSAVDLGVIAAEAAIQRAGIDPKEINETFVGNILMKFVVPALGISNPIISALITPILIGILIYFLFFKKSKPENNK